MNKFTHAVIAATMLSASTVTFSQTKSAKPATNQANQNNKYLNNQVVEVFPKGNINWTMQYVEAKGIGIIDNGGKKKNNAAAKDLALQAAKLDAQKNLFETLKNLNVVAETTIEDVVSNNDETNAKLQTLIQNAEQIGKPFETEVREEVTLRIPLYSVTGVAQILLETAKDIIDYIQVTDAQQNTAAKTNVAGTTSAETKSLVFNLNGKKIEPSMFPIIVDQNGDFLFDFTKVYNNYKGEFPIYIQLNQQNLASEEFLKTHIVVDMVEYNKGQMVISNKSKKNVNWSDYTQVVGKPGNVLITFY